jgi:lipid-A-disaccharide synthase
MPVSQHKGTTLSGQERQGVRIALVAGEASGDRLAADLVRSVQHKQQGVTFFGMGGQAMRSAGVRIDQDFAGLSVVGILEALWHYRRLRAVLEGMKRLIAKERPDLLVLVDYAEFNLRLADFAKSIGLKVLFYVSPQIWAWRPSRIHRMVGRIDGMAVLFPFEVPYYQAVGIPVRYVGNPLLDDVKPSADVPALRASFGLLKGNQNEPVLGLFPGSRESEWRRHMPLLIPVAQELAKHGVKSVVSVAPTLTIDLQEQAERHPTIQWIRGRSIDLMASCDALVVASGTATLEAGLLQRPMVVVYRLSWLSYGLLRFFVRVKDIALVNIVAGHRVVQEFVQSDFKVTRVTAETKRLLFDSPYKEKMVQELAAVRQSLGQGGASDRLADWVLELTQPQRDPS